MKNNQSIIFLLLFFTISITAFGQKEEKQPLESKSIIQFYDGSVFVGKITLEDGTNIHIAIGTGDTLHLKKAYIKRIKRSNKHIILHSGAKFHYTKGRFFSIQSGSNFTQFENSTSQIEFIAGYRFNKKISAGIGFGFSNNSTFFGGNWIETDGIPIFAYGRYYHFDNKIRPFIGGKLGWSFPNTNSFAGNHEGGLLIQPEIGLHFASRKKTRLIISLGQQIQNIKGTETDIGPFGNPIISNYKFWFNRTVFKIGIEWR